MLQTLRFSSLAAIAVALLLLLIPHPTHAATITVTMTDDHFTPQTITINAGDTVTWLNQGAMAHTATADSGAFDSGSVQPGQSFSATFNQSGTYAYHCKFHGSAGGIGMAGSITVGGSSVNTNTNTNTNTGTTYYSNPNSNYYSTVGASTYTNSANTTTSGSTAAQLQVQVQALLAQINALQQSIGTGGTTGTGNYAGTYTTNSSSCPLIGRSLHLGVTGDDVKRLQQFLARDPSIYPQGTASGYYGALTQAAVQKWQVKYNIVSSGSPDSTGYGVVGPRTAAAIALLCTTGSYGGVSGPPAQSPVGGFITVTPISGAAPLTVNVTATVNTTNSCAGAIYTLDFGDGSAPQQIPVSAGNCSQAAQTYPHVYQYGGTYQIALSAAGHQTSATVTVTGTPAPAPPVFTPGLPTESFNASPTSGAAPLNVTFSGTVNSNDKGFCTGGCASILDFGDGTSVPVNLPASVGGWLNYSVNHTYTTTGGFKATLYQGAAGAAQPTVGSATIIVNGGSGGGGGGTSNYSYSPPVLTPSTANSLSFSAQFDLPSSCTGYDFSWGDGTSHTTQTDGGSSCAQNSVVDTLTHTYSQGGSFTIVLKRGPTLSRTDDISITISN
jgi:plastocyanin